MRQRRMDVVRSWYLGVVFRIMTLRIYIAANTLFFDVVHMDESDIVRSETEQLTFMPTVLLPSAMCPFALWWPRNS